MVSFGNRQWSISVRASYNGADLRLLAEGTADSASTFSVFLRIRRFLLKVRSGSGGVTAAPREERRSRVLHFLRKVFRRRRQPGKVVAETTSRKSLDFHNAGKVVAENNAFSHPFQTQVPTMMGSLSLLSHSAAKKDPEGIVIHAFTFLFYLSLLFNLKKTYSPLFIVSIIISLVGFALSYLSYMDHVSKAAWKAWLFLISTGCLSIISKIIYPRILLHLPMNWFRGLPILALLSFLLYELGLRMLSGGMKSVVEAVPFLIPKLLVTCHAFSHISNKQKDLKSVGVCVYSAYFWLKEIISNLAPHTGK